ncbi:MAG: phosphate-starvation-inducible PsiE family protein [Pseudomonadota bacterium]
MTQNSQRNPQTHIELDPDHEDPTVRKCNRLIRHGVRVMSVFMVLVVGFAIIDAAYTLYIKVVNPPFFILDVSDLLDVFAAALVVLIAIEIYTNVTLYLTADVIHVKLVVATALMAVARKVITLDTAELDSLYFLGYSGLGLAFGVTYWLLWRGKSKRQETAF